MTRFGKPFGRGEKMKANRKAALDFHLYLANADITGWYSGTSHRLGDAHLDPETLLATQIEGRLLHELRYTSRFERTAEPATIFTALEWDVDRHHHKLLIGVIVREPTPVIAWLRRVPPRALMQGLHQTIAGETLADPGDFDGLEFFMMEAASENWSPKFSVARLQLTADEIDYALHLLTAAETVAPTFGTGVTIESNSCISTGWLSRNQLLAMREGQIPN